MKSILFFCLVAFRCLGVGGVAHASAITWTNANGGNWNVAANWSPNLVPGAGDDVTISGNVTLTEDVQAQSLLFSGGNLYGPGNLTLLGAFFWSTGIVYNRLQINGGTIAGTYSMELYGELINTGTLNWSGNYPVTTGQGSVISNAFGGVINLTGNDYGSAGTGYDNNNGGSPGTFYNAGQLNVLAADTAAEATIFDGFINTGTVTVNTGTLAIKGGGTSASAILLADNTATLEIGGGLAGNTFQFNSGSSLSGAGNLMISGGTLWYNGANFSFGGVLNLSSGGALEASQTMVLNNTLIWNGGNIFGRLQINGGTIAGTYSMELYGELINTGTLNWSGNYPVTTGQGSVISNAFGGVINLTGNDYGSAGTGYDNNNGGSPGTFYNAGQLNVLAADTAAEATIFDGFINTGTVTVNTGTLVVKGGGLFTSGILNFVITSPTNFGKINLFGSASLDGTLSATLNGGYIPNHTNAFLVLSYGSATGIFNRTNLPSSDAWQVNYNTQDLTLQVLNTLPVLL